MRRPATTETNDMHERTLSTQTHFTGRIVRLETQQVALADGHEAYREIIRHPGAVCVLLRAPDRRFVLVRQFRKAVEQVMTEVVAGIRHAGEDPADCARREIREETGYAVGRLVRMGTIFPTPGYVDERIEAFYAEAIGAASDRDLDEDERVEPVMVSESELAASIRRGELTDGKTLAAWAMYREGAAEDA